MVKLKEYREKFEISQRECKDLLVEIKTSKEKEIKEFEEKSMLLEQNRVFRNRVEPRSLAIEDVANKLKKKTISTKLNRRNILF